MSHTPSSLDLNALSIGKLYHELVEKAKTSNLAVEPLLYKKCRFKVLLRGDIITNGVNAGMYGQSLGLRLSDPQDTEALKKFQQLALGWTNFQVNASTDISQVVRPLIKGDAIFLKLRQKGDQYRFTSDIPMDPATPGPHPARGTAVEIVTEFSFYLNTKDDFSGFIVDLISLKTKFKKSKQ